MTDAAYDDMRRNDAVRSLRDVRRDRDLLMDALNEDAAKERALARATTPSDGHHIDPWDLLADDE